MAITGRKPRARRRSIHPRYIRRYAGMSRESRPSTLQDDDAREGRRVARTWSTHPTCRNHTHEIPGIDSAQCACARGNSSSFQRCTVEASMYAMCLPPPCVPRLPSLTRRPPEHRKHASVLQLHLMTSVVCTIRALEEISPGCLRRTRSGAGLVTTLPALTMQCCPSEAMTIAPSPIQLPAPIVMASKRPSPESVGPRRKLPVQG